MTQNTQFTSEDSDLMGYRPLGLDNDNDFSDNGLILDGES